MARLYDASDVCQALSLHADEFALLLSGASSISDAITCSKIEFAEAVRAEGIDLNPHYKYVVCEWPYIRPYLADDFDTPNARSIRDRSFNLYLNEKYGEQEAKDTVAAIRKVEGHFAKT